MHAMVSTPFAFNSPDFSMNEGDGGSDFGGGGVFEWVVKRSQSAVPVILLSSLLCMFNLNRESVFEELKP
ncbi:hypothetical protein L1987_03386 [Smallanthus sonchifolius]|uniref:Uncharacterized protein n=1 Tax=Smallanthus sonchifolius TaxID=185202 RepID=A0ACB9KAI7_9ASTR|nr:hypothetical protein L1987_03386 [Smallanthus sonchifolius]